MIFTINGKKFRWNYKVAGVNAFRAAVILGLALAFDYAMFISFMGGF